MRAEPSPASVEFTDGTAILRFTMLRRPFPDSENDWDRDAIDCGVSVLVHPFAGEFDTTVWSHELEFLRSLLLKLYRGVGSPAKEEFRLREGTVSIGFTLTERGSITINVDVAPDPAEGPHLVFEVHTDQSYLPMWTDEITRALTQFPRQLRSSD